jgi:hypothetical protein
MNPVLLAALIDQVAIPELVRWLSSLHASGTPVTDAVIIQKLASDTNLGETIGLAWLAAHPVSVGPVAPPPVGLSGA